ncbi:Putative UBX domain, UBA-like superfamily, Ubiquitin-like domain superfamily [Septoria linicola]|uniref:UBX domain, UBA-like superfamily, Ubiquitin-like domain superfamily n=1 Tax=Septoria linicola TaxID=215465 RepID=A0A9Q9EN86_9PEZI|nr:putative UBX domain, UBA-like superfamily, Ubiquitin-like domain superfamily [Septoria linicola]USW57541.1 Putative UBX domain, UBA-like superfamily, Ubiquitin-like domain superfamily [Septoria linicola]
MANDEEIATFTAFTSGTAEQAQRFLQLTDNNVEQAVELFFSNPDLGNTAGGGSGGNAAAPSTSTNDPIQIDSDDDDDVVETGSRPAQHNFEDDEAMARRLQEEMYGGPGRSGGMGEGDDDEVRAPMARTTETLVGPGSYGGGFDVNDPGQMNAAIAEQLMRRNQRSRAAPGIFNQRDTRSIWNDDDPTDPDAHRRALSRATGGSSEQSAKASHLADLFRPPVDLITPLSLADARDEGKDLEKWLLVNVQDPSIFDCQVLNRDIWKNDQIRETIKEHFLFLQYNKDDPRGSDYVNYYFSNSRDNEAAYPHIAIIDPRTGEQVKTWSGSPSPKAPDFLMDLHEFLDRYSLNMNQKNPVQTKRKESKKDISTMSEEEQLELAMQASMGAGSAAHKDEDPDVLTKGANGKGKAPVTITDDSAMDVDEAPVVKKDTPFSRISDSTPHEEPTSTDPKETTRIQFKHSGGRIIRRFNLSDPVRRIYEWLKASPVEGHDGQPFELISLGKNLIDQLDTSIADASLKQGTVMVEFVEDE